LRITIEEGKNKIIKKIKELLSKYKLEYDEKATILFLNTLIDFNFGFPSFFEAKDTHDISANENNVICLNDTLQEEKDNLNSELKTENINSPKVKKKYQRKKREVKVVEEVIHHSSPVLSKQFHVKQFDENDFFNIE